MNEYNGWTNYETWLVNLEMGFTDNLHAFEARNLDDLRVDLKVYAENAVESDNTLATNFAYIILAEVDWDAIAEVVLERLMRIGMEDFDPRTWTNIPTWRANLEMRFTENLEDFAGLELDEIIDALVNHAYKAVESENPLATDLAEAFFFDVDWQNIAQVILDKLK